MTLCDAATNSFTALDTTWRFALGDHGDRDAHGFSHVVAIVVVVPPVARCNVRARPRP